jgi:hypothetical protein
MQRFIKNKGTFPRLDFSGTAPGLPLHIEKCTAKTAYLRRFCNRVRKLSALRCWVIFGRIFSTILNLHVQHLSRQAVKIRAF